MRKMSRLFPLDALPEGYTVVAYVDEGSGNLSPVARCSKSGPCIECANRFHPGTDVVCESLVDVLDMELWDNGFDVVNPIAVQCRWWGSRR